MVPDTGYLQYFDLIPYKAGLMLMLPDRSEPETLVPFEPREKLFHTLLRSNDWGEKMEIETVGDLNDKICEGDLAEMILVQEARQERRIAEIAGDIVRRGNVKFVMIAGPSSSGKTTFSHRLAIQLKTHGPVSYTHLDVYKRQMRESVRWTKSVPMALSTANRACAAWISWRRTARG